MAAADRGRRTGFQGHQRWPSPTLNQPDTTRATLGWTHIGEQGTGGKDSEQPPDETTGFQQLIEAAGQARPHITPGAAVLPAPQLRIGHAGQTDTQTKRM